MKTITTIILVLSLSCLGFTQEYNSIFEMMNQYLTYKANKDKDGMLSLISENWFVVDNLARAEYNNPGKDLDFYIAQYDTYHYNIIYIQHESSSLSAIVTVFESRTINNNKASFTINYVLVKKEGNWIIVSYIGSAIVNPVTKLLNKNNEEMPDKFELSQNYPNPFNPSTTINYEIEKPGNVSVKIFNTNGRLVHTLVDERKLKGSHNATWNGRDSHGNLVSSGQYFYRIELDGRHVSRKMLKLK